LILKEINKVIIWYCDICGKRITDDGPLRRLGGTVWELNGTAEQMFNTVDNKGGTFLKTILCTECKADVIYRMYEMIQQIIKDRKKGGVSNK
jgi:hypothetical protein